MCSTNSMEVPFQELEKSHQVGGEYVNAADNNVNTQVFQLVTHKGGYPYMPHVCNRMLHFPLGKYIAQVSFYALILSLHIDVFCMQERSA